MIRNFLPFAALLAFGTAACETRDPVADEANEIIATPTASAADANDAAAEPADAADANASAPAPVIPASLHGRWGMTPADCTTTMGDDKGLLTIGPNSLKFYESRAVPGTSIETGPNSISGNFDFAGEGERWTDYLSLKLNGKVLVRTDRDPPASTNYARC